MELNPRSPHPEPPCFTRLLISSGDAIMHVSQAVFTSLKRYARTTTFGLSVMALLMMAGPNAHAQVTATISGTVTDPTGATVQGASISVINEAMQDVRPSETNKSEERRVGKEGRSRWSPRH